MLAVQIAAEKLLSAAPTCFTAVFLPSVNALGWEQRAGCARAGLQHHAAAPEGQPRPLPFLPALLQM